MSGPSKFLKGSDAQDLCFVRNELEENISQLLNGAGSSGNVTPREPLIVQPKPGFCVKSFKVNTNEKFFMNVCQAPEVPSPRDVTEIELIEILQSPTPDWRVPMSLSEPRNTKDRSGNTVEVCDIAINPGFLKKIKRSQFFNNFFLNLVSEALSEKYNIQISMERIIILNNRKFIDTLVSHRVRNDDDSEKYGHTDGCGGQKQLLVQEIDEQELENLSKKSEDVRADNSVKLKRAIPKVNSKNFEYKLRARVKDDVAEEIYAELYLPNCISSQELSVDIGEDRILVESLKYGIVFDKFLNYRLHQERAQALFDKTSKMLQIRIPVIE
ncbi:PIH1 domain-containing protein 1-like [Scaptodrosophila lebanonensis]|uniref:PIH1 domain-containing protein 1 n=1 Tax=Drosophila lebanonensis TaxID=7225 RepID=A0A6J2THP0_DROLE|nr:PIH1 domain-containing protein 1-like [Scaptodrosophila lebanonensis]